LLTHIFRTPLKKPIEKKAELFGFNLLPKTNLSFLFSDELETRMVFGLNGDGFIIPLMIRLKLENLNDDFGVCALLTSVNQEKEYLFISDSG